MHWPESKPDCAISLRHNPYPLPMTINSIPIGARIRDAYRQGTNRSTHRTQMLKTMSMHEAHGPQHLLRNGDRYWTAALLPVADGIFLVDIHWAENKFERIQSLVCPATIEGVFSLHGCEYAIHALLYIAPPNHDGTPREPPISVIAIGFGHNADDNFRDVLLVRTLDGQWHACAEGVDIARVDERKTLLVLHKDEPKTGAA
jgi:hypothetical protein